MSGVPIFFEIKLSKHTETLTDKSERTSYLRADMIRPTHPVGLEYHCAREVPESCQNGDIEALTRMLRDIMYMIYGDEYGKPLFNREVRDECRFVISGHMPGTYRFLYDALMKDGLPAWQSPPT